MTDKFQSLRLTDGIISNGERAYSLTGVTAAIRVNASPAKLPLSARVLEKLRGTQVQGGGAVVVEGPGFSWKVPVGTQRITAAREFVEKINDAARRLRV